MNQFNNTTSLLLYNNSTATTGVPWWQPVLVATFYLGVSAGSFVLHLIVFLGIIKCQGPVTKFSSFYILLTNLYLSDGLKPCFYIVYACPCIYAGQQVYGALMAEILGEFESIDYVAILITTFFISVNRALAVGAPVLQEKIFGNRSATVCCCIFCWLMGLLTTVINRHYTCRTVFLEAKYAFSTVCQTNPVISPGSIIVYVVAYGVASFYGFGLASLFYHRRKLIGNQVNSNIRGHQLRLFLQAMCIWMGVLGNAIAFRIIPLFTPSISTALATAVVIIGQSYITPLCMLVFVKDTRSAIKSVWSRRSKTDIVHLQIGNQRSSVNKI